MHILKPGDIAMLNENYYDGMTIVLGRATPFFVVATYDIDNGTEKWRAPERIMVLRAGEPRLLNLQRKWLEHHCKMIAG